MLIFDPVNLKILKPGLNSVYLATCWVYYLYQHHYDLCIVNPFMRFLPLICRYNIPYKHIIVDIETEQITHFLDVASRMGILTSYHHYMFTSLVSRLFITWPCFHLPARSELSLNSSRSLI